MPSGRDEPDQRRAERPLHFRPRNAQHHDARADDDEGRQRADGNELAQNVERQHARTQRAECAGDERAAPRRPEARMNLAEQRRDHSVLRHRVEDARLAEQQHQHNRGEADDGADIDERCKPGGLRQGLDGLRHGVRHIQRGVGARCRSAPTTSACRARCRSPAIPECRWECRAAGCALPVPRRSPRRTRYRRRRSRRWRGTRPSSRNVRTCRCCPE